MILHREIRISIQQEGDNWFRVDVFPSTDSISPMGISTDSDKELTNLFVAIERAQDFADEILRDERWQFEFDYQTKGVRQLPERF